MRRVSTTLCMCILLLSHDTDREDPQPLSKIQLGRCTQGTRCSPHLCYIDTNTSWCEGQKHLPTLDAIHANSFLQASSPEEPRPHHFLERPSCRTVPLGPGPGPLFWEEALLRTCNSLKHVCGNKRRGCLCPTPHVQFSKSAATNAEVANATLSPTTRTKGLKSPVLRDTVCWAEHWN